MKNLNLLVGLLLVFCAATFVQPNASGMNVVVIETATGAPAWTVELASDNASRSRGLMYRKSMAQQTGMLFRMENSRMITMWMKNTFIPLDMVFADPQGRIVHIHRGAVPHSLDHISSRQPARYVLEVNAGEVDQYGVSVGDVLKHPWILPAG